MTVSVSSGVSLVNVGITPGQLPDYKIIEINQDYTADGSEDIIISTGSVTITLIDPALATKPVTIRDIAGLTAIVSAAGGLELAGLTVGQSVKFSPTPTEWVIV